MNSYEVMNFPKSKVTIQLEVPQEFENFAGLFGPLGLFIYAFIRLERNITWSYVACTNNCSCLETSSILSRDAEFEGGNKRTTDRISKWFKAIRGPATEQNFLGDLNKLKSDLVDLTNHRNRLAHDPAGSLSTGFRNGAFFGPDFHFSQQMKDGEVKIATYSGGELLEFVDETLSLSSEIRRVTLMLVPDAPNIVI